VTIAFLKALHAVFIFSEQLWTNKSLWIQKLACFTITTSIHSQMA